MGSPSPVQRILTLKPAFQGLSEIVNVLARVGPTEANNPDDVKVVQTLVRMIRSNFAKKVGLPQVTGKYDAVTGFWIYDTQNFIRSKGSSGIIVDGIVSPAHGSQYAAGAPWAIVVFNHQAQVHSPDEYTAFVEKVKAGGSI